MKHTHIPATALILTVCITLYPSLVCARPISQTPAQQLIKTLNTHIQQKHTLFGHQDSTLYGHGWQDEENRSDIKDITGHYPAVIGYDLGGIELARTKNLDNVSFSNMRAEIIKHHTRGGINTLSWHSFLPDGQTSWTKGNGHVTKLLPGGFLHNEFKLGLSRVAEFLLSLKDERGNLIPIIFRPWHEHKGNWFWWGEKRCTHDEYKALWTITHDFMTDKGLNNLVWCYMPYNGYESKMPPPLQYDMYGIDTYQRAPNPERYIKETQDGIATMKALSAKDGKPIAITETGYEGIKDPNWWTHVLYPIIEDKTISYVLMWRNAHHNLKHFYAPYKGHISETDFKKFIASPQVKLAP